MILLSLILILSLNPQKGDWRVRWLNFQCESRVGQDTLISVILPQGLLLERACRAFWKGFFRHRQMTKGRQPILTISAVAPALSSISSFSRRLERLSPRSASSGRSLSSDVVFSEPDKSGVSFCLRDWQHAIFLTLNE